MTTTKRKIKIYMKFERCIIIITKFVSNKEV